MWTVREDRKARPQCGRHATLGYHFFTVKSPSSPTVLTRLSAADHAPLLGEHIAGPYSNRVLSLYSLLPAIARCSLFSINTSHPSISLWEHRHERDHTDNESRETTVLRLVPDFVLYMYTRA